MKLLVILATIALLVWLLRRDLPSAARARKAAQDNKAKPAAPPPPPPKGPEVMVSCATCGLHLPASDALPAPNGSYYCCAEHRKLPA